MSATLLDRVFIVNISYFDDTDTLYIEFSTTEEVETRDLDENTQLEIDGQGRLISLTMEHISQRTDIRNLELSGFD